MIRRVSRIVNIIRSLCYYKLFLKCKSGLRVWGKVKIESRNIYLGKNVSIYDGVHIWGTGKIIIGDNVAIGKDTIIFCDDEIEIGNNVLIAGQSYIIDSDHGINKEILIREQKLISKKITIQDDVWIGAGAKVLKGCTIRRGSIIGANGVVTRDTLENSINVGVPCKFLKYRERE